MTPGGVRSAAPRQPLELGLSCGKALALNEQDCPLPPLESQADLLRRIAEALERLAPPAPPPPDFDAAEAFVWRADSGALAPVARVNRVDISLLRGIDRVRDLLVENTERFARALPANNALLWGARGMGKSSLVKAAHAAINRESGVAGRSSWSKSIARTSRACRR